jgi:glycosyltransferase involved in cell wall biosynthesis
VSGKRVLILLQNEPVPSDRHVWNQSTALVRAGYVVTVVCPTGEERDRGDYERTEGVTIHRYEPRRADERASAYALEYLAALRSIRRLANQLGRSEPFDLVHACSPPDFLLLAALGLRRRGARFVFDHHDLTPELYLTRFGGGLLHRVTLIAEQVAFRSADVVLSVNDSYRRVAIERGRRDPADVTVVRTGPDLTRFVPSEPDPALKRGKRFLLSYAGVMGPQDGVDHALLALAELRAMREDWHAVFMGDGDVVESMRAMAGELGLADCVEFSGWVEHDQISRVLSTSDVCLAPDPKNPLNDVSSMIKISEYMAMSRPIVSYDLAESRVGAGEAALFAAPDDHAGFARLVSQLLDDPERRAEMGAAGRARAEDVLAWEHQERALLGAYSRALAMGPVREGRLAAARRLLLPHRPPGNEVIHDAAPATEEASSHARAPQRKTLISKWVARKR